MSMCAARSHAQYHTLYSYTSEQYRKHMPNRRMLTRLAMNTAMSIESIARNCVVSDIREEDNIRQSLNTPQNSKRKSPVLH